MAARPLYTHHAPTLLLYKRRRTSPLVFIPVLLSGFLVNPVWYLWLGFALWRKPGR